VKAWRAGSAAAVIVSALVLSFGGSSAYAAPAGRSAADQSAVVQVREKITSKAQADALARHAPAPGRTRIPLRVPQSVGRAATDDVPLFCFMDITNPQLVAGPSVEVDALIVCDALADVATLVVDIYRDNALVAEGGLTLPFLYGLSIAIQTRCITGNYVGIATGEMIYFDPFPGTFITGIAGSGPVFIQCPITINPPDCTRPGACT
jgi:hypothetical protein